MRPVPALMVVLAVGAGMFASAGSSTADVSSVDGLAFNYYTDVSLFGGPSARRGYGQAATAPATAASPSVECPEGGGTDTDVDSDGASAEYGPAVIFGGKYPDDPNASAQPSGPMTSTISCDLGAGGGVTASTSLTLMPAGSAYPGGAGPGPFVADEVHSTCTATEDGFTASTTIVGGILETSYDPNTQLPATTEPIPVNPTVNYTRIGTIDHVGDSYSIIFNEQIENPDGSITVNAAHMFLEGPIAVGEMVVGSSTCGPLTITAPPTTAPPTTAPPTTAPPTTAPPTTAPPTTAPPTTAPPTTAPPTTAPPTTAPPTTAPPTTAPPTTAPPTTAPPTTNSCLGLAATIVGTAGDDHLRGTEARDVIMGLGGDDHISGFGGDDVICAGDGDDHVLGGSGDDAIAGGAGDDHLIGGPGDDTLDGGADEDKCNGNGGDDDLISCEKPRPGNQKAKPERVGKSLMAV